MTTPRLSRRSHAPRTARQLLDRSGSVYPLVLGCALIVFVTGVSTIALATSSSRATVASSSSRRAAILARSAIEVIIAGVNQNTAWRSGFTSGVAFSFQLESTKVEGMVVDEADDDLTNSDAQMVRIYTSVGVGPSRRVFSALAEPASVAGLDLLRCAVHSNANITVSAGKTLALQAGPASTNANFTNSGIVIGDAEVTGTYSSTGLTTGLVTQPAPVKPMPASAAVLALFSDATTVNLASLPLLGGKLEHAVLSSASSPFGTPNAAGKYVLNMSLLSAFTIKHARLKATVLVNLPVGATLVIGDQVCWEPADPLLPALVVNGNGTVEYTSNGAVLAEGGSHGNFNPAGTPYNGVVDNDTTDSYPAQINGIVHMLSPSTTTILDLQSRIVGCLISAGPITVDEYPRLTANQTLIANPPRGYTNTAGGKMRIVPGSFRWELADNPYVKVRMIDTIPPVFANPGVVQPIVP